MFDVREFNVSIELWAVLFCLVGIVCVLLFTRPGDRFRRPFIALFSLELVSAGGDALAGIFRGQAGEVAWAMTHLGNHATFVGAFLLLAVLTSYLCSRIEEVGGSRYGIWVKVVIAASLLMSLLSLAGAFFFIDEGNLYHRSQWHVASLGFSAVVNVVNACLLLRNAKRFSRASLACLLFYALAPMVAALVQARVYGVNFVIIASVMSTILLFLEMQANSARQMVQQAEALASSQVEVSESRIAVMVSQIQPHFLFNTLDTIYGLCDEDAKLAQEAIASFSRYLRTNLNSLRQMAPVSIETEMEHVRTYLELECMADDERLSFDIDMQATGFLVPALSVQVLAENAVKHGIAKKLEGGQVIIRTREQPHEYTVSVVDDGVGFEPADNIEQIPGVGLANTQARLHAMVNGWLEVLSEPGLGTTAIIHVPRESSEGKARK